MVKMQILVRNFVIKRDALYLSEPDILHLKS
jgi:hypothetical protein